ncbi:phosphatidylinositol-binding protein scs2 [Pseudogymnoascus australis]
MSVEIDPQELGFHRPFTREVSQVLKIKNPNLTPVAFKVKTTAPKQYCVRPNSGRIEPGKEVEVSVLLQAMKVEPPADTRCRDKFLVQSVAVTADKEFTNIAQIWQHVDQAEKSSVQEKKIRVVFLAEESAGQNLPAVSTPLRNGVNTSLNDTTPNTAAPQYHSPYQEESAPRSAPLSEATGNRSVSDSKSTQLRAESSPQPAEPAVSKANAKENIKAVPAAVSSALPNSVEELKAQLAQAQATIASYGQEGGLRLRKAGNALGVDEVAPAAQAAVRTTVQEGVPVHIVAALVLITFLTAYFFF